MAKNSIILLLPSLNTGGAERIFVKIANSLSSDQNVYVAIIRKQGGLLKELSDQVNVIDLKGQFIWLYQLAKLLRKTGPVSLVSTFWDVNLILTSLQFSFPKTTRLIFREPVFPSATIKHSQVSFLARLFYRYGYTHVDAVIVLSHTMQEDLCNHTAINKDKIHVISNAVDFPYDSIPEKKENECFKLISCGRLVPQKGYDNLLLAYARLLQEKPNCLLTLIGEGPDKERLFQQASYLNIIEKIVFTGQLENPREEFLKSDLYVLSSIYEGVSNSMLEALSVGLPVLATTENTNAENFIKENLNGFIINESSANSLYHGLVKAINESGKLNRKKIVQDARQNLSMEAMIQKYRYLLLHE